MANRNWKRVYPTSLRNAIELCVDYAKAKKNIGVERIADLMGLDSYHTLYKWMASAKMPANMIRPFEHACGIDYVTQYLAITANKLLIDIPTGRTAQNREVSELSRALHDMIGQIYAFHDGTSEALDVIEAITSRMEDLGYHRANIQKNQQPELELA